MTHEPNTQGASWEAIQAIIRARDSKMYGYYKSVFEHDFEGGYPIEWDTEAIEAIRTFLSKERAEGERRGREKALESIHAVLVGFDTQNRPAWELFDLITATLPADSTEGT